MKKFPANVDFDLKMRLHMLNMHTINKYKKVKIKI